MSSASKKLDNKKKWIGASAALVFEFVRRARRRLGRGKLMQPVRGPSRVARRRLLVYATRLWLNADVGAMSCKSDVKSTGTRAFHLLTIHSPLADWCQKTGSAFTKAAKKYENYLYGSFFISPLDKHMLGRDAFHAFNPAKWASKQSQRAISTNKQEKKKKKNSKCAGNTWQTQRWDFQGHGNTYCCPCWYIKRGGRAGIINRGEIGF